MYILLLIYLSIMEATKSNTSVKSNRSEKIDNLNFAKEKRKLGSEQFRAQHYESALQLYSEAIAICPEVPSFYSIRSVCHMMLMNYEEGLNDAREAIRLDSQFKNAYIHALNCYIALGDTAGADETIMQILKLDASCILVENAMETLAHLQKLEKDIRNYYECESYEDVVFYCNLALSSAPACLKYHAYKIYSLICLNKVEEAFNIVSEIKLNKDNAYGIFIKGLTCFYADRLVEAIEKFEQAIELEPTLRMSIELRRMCIEIIDSVKNGKKLCKNYYFENAKNIFTAILNRKILSPKTKCRILNMRASAYINLGDFIEAIHDCTSVLQINQHYLKSLLLRAKCYCGMEQYEDSITDYKAALEIHQSDSIESLLRDVTTKYIDSQYTNYYQVLDVCVNATLADIKKSYRKLAKIHHPDRHANSTAEERMEAEIIFKKVVEAYTTLSDPNKRSQYDREQNISNLNE